MLAVGHKPESGSLLGQSIFEALVLDFQILQLLIHLV